MRIAVMGAGGLGGYYGARLAKGGADVVFVARGAHLDAMKANGLTVESTIESFALPRVTATDDPASIGGPVDVVLFTVKLWDTEAAARAILPIVGPDTAVLSLQNGVQKDDMLRPILGEAPVMGAIAQISAAVPRPGTITQVGQMQRLAFGEFDGRVSPRAEALLEACKAGGVAAEISPDITREIWQKFVFLVGLSATTCATRCTIGPVRTNPHTRALLLGVMEEVVAVARASGVSIAEDFAADRLAFVDTLPAEMVASMYHDLAAGRRLELPWLSGGVVDLGAAVGVPTPLNEAIRDVLILHTAGRLA